MCRWSSKCGEGKAIVELQKYGVRIKGEKCGTMQRETRVEMSEMNAMKGRDGKS